MFAAHTTFRREGRKLVLVDEWVSDDEKRRRADRLERERKFEAWEAEFKKTDPLYLAFERLVANPAFSPEEHMWLGVVHDSWCPYYKSEGCKERRFGKDGKDIVRKDGLKIAIEWAVDAGPVKLEVQRPGVVQAVQADENIVVTDALVGWTEFFEHSASGMERAFARAKEAVTAAISAAATKVTA